MAQEGFGGEVDCDVPEKMLKLKCWCLNGRIAAATELQWLRQVQLQDGDDLLIHS